MHNLEAWRVADMKTFLSSNHLPRSGSKNALITNITNAFKHKSRSVAQMIQNMKQCIKAAQQPTSGKTFKTLPAFINVKDVTGKWLGIRSFFLTRYNYSSFLCLYRVVLLLLDRSFMDRYKCSIGSKRLLGSFGLQWCNTSRCKMLSGVPLQMVSGNLHLCSFHLFFVIFLLFLALFDRTTCVSCQ